MRTRWITLGVSVLLLAGCGGGGGADPSSVNGWWEMQVPFPSVSDPYAFLYLGPASQADQAVRYAGLDWTLDGNHLRAGDPDYVSPDRDEYDLAAVSADLLEGTFRSVHADGSTSSRGIRLLRTATPTGTATGAGTADGPVDWSCPTAYAVVTAQPVDAITTSYSVGIVDAGPEVSTTLILDFSLATGTAFPVVKEVTAEATIRFGRGDDSWSATLGEIVLTTFETAGLVRGTYQAILGLHGAVTGTFDVPVYVLR